MVMSRSSSAIASAVTRCNRATTTAAGNGWVPSQVSPSLEGATRSLAAVAGQALLAGPFAPLSRSAHIAPTPVEPPTPNSTPEEDFSGRKIKRYEKQGHNFPDFIEHWGRRPFYMMGTAGTLGAAALMASSGPAVLSSWAAVGAVSYYWYQGFHDMRQNNHTIKRNYPVLGNIRFLLESIRPEIRQYFVEADSEASPFSRMERSVVYQRAKLVQDSMAFGTRHPVYHDGYQFLKHSLWPKDLHGDTSASRVLIGANNPQCTQPYSSSIFNVSAMSYGALSDNAILALNTAAEMGDFSHNTGEGGISRFHLQPQGDIVWNVGTGYFGCRATDGTFSAERFKENATRPQVKMIEIKLSQGAKPAHGGMLPGNKVTQEIAEARGIEIGQTCNSPPVHSAFRGPSGLVDFIRQLRELSGGKPVGFKLCIGQQEEFAALVHAMLKANCYPDFITVDGGEGGTGAAPPEFSDSVGMPLRDALVFADNILTAAGIRDKVTLICSGRTFAGFCLVRNMALGADVCNSARAMMFALGCIQALKCNTNRCPTGITTMDKDLMQGLDVENKAVRVYNYHKKTVQSAIEIMGAAGVCSPREVKRSMIMFRPDGPMSLASYADFYPPEHPGSLLSGTASAKLSHVWLVGEQILKDWDNEPQQQATAA